MVNLFDIGPLALNRAGGLLWAAVLSFPALLAAEPVPLVFSHPVGVPQGNGAFGRYFTSSVLEYTNVGTAGGVNLNARVSVAPWGNATFGTGLNSGLYAGYSSNLEEPNGDAGLFYTAETTGAGGLHYDLEFFVAGSGFIDPFVVEEFNLLVYDVDGDVSQRESLSAYAADGFTSYRLSEGVSSLTVSDIGGNLNFTGRAENFAETAINGAVILNFRNTSRIRLDFSAATTGGLPNGSFAGIDGDLSFPAGDFSGFGPVQNVPEPAGGALLAAAAACGFMGRRRPSSAPFKRLRGNVMAR